MVTDVLAVDEAQVGALYSQLTGVLAGFSFAGLTLVITLRLSSHADPETANALPDDSASANVQPATDSSAAKASMDHSALLLFASFLGLTLSSLGYAVLGGQKNLALAAVQHVVAGVGFTAAALLLLLAIREMLAPVAPDAYRFAHRVVGSGAPLVAALYVLSGAWDAARRVFDEPGWSVLLIPVSLVLGSATAWGVVRHLRRAPDSPLATRLSRVGIFTWAAGSGVTISLIASLLVPVLDGIYGTGHTAPFPPVWLAVGVSGFVAVAFWSLCGLTKGGEPRNNQAAAVP